MIANSIRLFKSLPTGLAVAWAVILTGLVMLFAGYFTRTEWQSYTGLGCLIAGYLLAILDMIFRKRERYEASGFYVGLTLAPMIALYLIVFIGLLGAIVLAVKSAMDGYSAAHGWRLLHFTGIIFAFLVVSGIPALALGAQNRTETGAEEPGDPNA